jgi:hypothetical protein
VVARKKMPPQYESGVSDADALELMSTQKDIKCIW